MIDRTELVTTGNDPKATLFDWRIVEMEDGGRHATPSMRKVRIVLVHGKGRALFRRLDEELRVMQLNVGSDDVGGDAGETIVDEQLQEEGRKEFHVMPVQKLSRGSRIHGAGALPGGLYAHLGLAQTLDQLMRFP